MSHPSKVKGSAFERLICDYLTALGIPAERIPAGASDDRGDIWVPGVTIQCKNQARMALPAWWADTQRQRDTNDHTVGLLVHKRHGVTDPSRQWVTVDLAQAVELIAPMVRR